LTIQLGIVSVKYAFEIVKKAYSFRNLTLDVFCDVLELLDANYLLFFNREKMNFGKKGRTYRYYFENLSTIPDILKFKVFDSVGKKIIGTLDQRFVGDFGDSECFCFKRIAVENS